MKDNISDMLTRIRNGQNAKLKNIILFYPTPKICIMLLDVLKKNGFIWGYTFINYNNKEHLNVFLKYTKDQNPIIKKIKRISTPGKRIYIRSTLLWKKNTGMGIFIISTHMGLKTDNECRFLNLGGELICYIQ